MPGRMIDLDGRGFGGVVSSIRAGDFRSRGHRMLSIRAVQAATEQETRDVLHVPFHYHWLDRIGYFEKVLTHVTCSWQCSRSSLSGSGYCLFLCTADGECSDGPATQVCKHMSVSRSNISTAGADDGVMCDDVVLLGLRWGRLLSAISIPSSRLVCFGSLL